MTAACEAFFLWHAGPLLPDPSPFLLHHLVPAVLGSSHINWSHLLSLCCVHPIYFGTHFLWLNIVKTSFDFWKAHFLFTVCTGPHFREQALKKMTYFFKQLSCNYKSMFVRFCVSLSLLQAPLFGPQHTLVLQCLSLLGVFDDWIILFAYVTGFKTVLTLTVKDMFCVFIQCVSARSSSLFLLESCGPESF